MGRQEHGPLKFPEGGYRWHECFGGRDKQKADGRIGHKRFVVPEDDSHPEGIANQDEVLETGFLAHFRKNAGGDAGEIRPDLLFVAVFISCKRGADFPESATTWIIPEKERDPVREQASELFLFFRNHTFDDVARAAEEQHSHWTGTHAGHFDGFTVEFDPKFGRNDFTWLAQTVEELPVVFGQSGDGDFKFPPVAVAADADRVRGPAENGDLHLATGRVGDLTLGRKDGLDGCCRLPDRTLNNPLEDHPVGRIRALRGIAPANEFISNLPDLKHGSESVVPSELQSAVREPPGAFVGPVGYLPILTNGIDVVDVTVADPIPGQIFGDRAGLGCFSRCRFQTESRVRCGNTDDQGKEEGGGEPALCDRGGGARPGMKAQQIGIHGGYKNGRCGRWMVGDPGNTTA